MASNAIYKKTLEQGIKKLEEQLEEYTELSTHDKDFEEKRRKRDGIKWKLHAKKESLRRISKTYRSLDRK